MSARAYIEYLDYLSYSDSEGWCFRRCWECYKIFQANHPTNTVCSDQCLEFGQLIENKQW